MCTALLQATMTPTVLLIPFDLVFSNYLPLLSSRSIPYDASHPCDILVMDMKPLLSRIVTHDYLTGPTIIRSVWVAARLSLAADTHGLVLYYKCNNIVCV